MPSAISLFKAVAESLIQVMTMLLQILIQHLEVQTAPMGNVEAPLETNQQIQVMMEELHAQRLLLEKATQPKALHQQTAQGSAHNPKMPTKFKAPPASKYLNFQDGSGSQAKGSDPSAKKEPMSWCLPESEEEEEEEDVLVLESEELGTPAQVEMPVVNNSAHRKPSQGHPSFEEWGRKVITWGKKHREHTCEQVMCQDLGYFEWCQRRFPSLTPEIQNFARYGQLRLSRVAAEGSAASEV